AVRSMRIILQHVDEAAFEFRAAQKIGRYGGKDTVVQDGQLVAQVGGQLQDVGGKNEDVPLFHVPQQLLHLQRDDDVEGGERFVEQNDGRLGDQKQQHLDFVFHAVGIVLDQPVPVFPRQPHPVEPVVDPLVAGELVPVDVHEKLD